MPGMASYMLFDVAVAGLYAAQVLRPGPVISRNTQQLTLLWVLLTAWPILLFFLADGDLIIELVGLRANIYLLPFVLFGPRLNGSDLRSITVVIAVLNLAAFSVAAYEYFVGLDALVPRNEVTALVYRSHDVMNDTAYRIPSSFVNAHAYAGTMVMTVPLLVGLWVQTEVSKVTRLLLGLAILASLVGIFIAATRTHVIVLALLLVVSSFAMPVRGRQWLRWVMVLLITGGVVSSEARLQRFTTLADSIFISERVRGSVNASFFELIEEYPWGSGLASGGTNVPFFFSERVNPWNALKVWRTNMHDL